VSIPSVPNYGIRPDYVANKENRARREEGAVFWSPRRIRYALWYQWHVYAWARDLVRNRKIRTAVDVGCGPAVKFEALLVPEVDRAIGIDQPHIIDYCRKTYAPDRYVSDDFEAPRLDLGEKADLIICCDVIEHVMDPDILLSYIKRLATPDTLILISTPDRDAVRGPGSLTPSNADHVREWTAAEFRTYLEGAGFAVDELRHLPPLKPGPNLLTAVHLLHALRPGRSWRFNMAALCRVKPSA